MAKTKKTWVYNPKKDEKIVPENIKNDLTKKGNELIKNIFKPKFVQPLPEILETNQIVDIYTKWYKNYFYFCTKYKCTPESLCEYFDDKFARMEYLEEDKFELSYMRYTEKWWPLRISTMDDCLNEISTMSPI